MGVKYFSIIVIVYCLIVMDLPFPCHFPFTSEKGVPFFKIRLVFVARAINKVLIQ